MINLGLAAIAGIVVMGFVFLLRPAKGDVVAPPYPIVALPLALLFLTALIPLIGYQTITDFQNIAATGRAGLKEAAALSLNILRPMWLACFGFIATLGAAAALQFLRVPAMPEAAAADRPSAAAWILYLSAVLALPAAAVFWMMRGVADLVMRAGIAVVSSIDAMDAGPPPFIDGMSLPEISQFLSQRLVISVLGGGILALIVFSAAVVNLIANRFVADTPGLRRFSLVVTVTGGALGLIALFLLTAAIRAVAAT